MTGTMIMERSVQVRYQGTRTKKRCVIRRFDPDGSSTMIFPGPSRKIRDHSPTGFEWGYGGSGPAQTALALCLDFTGDPEMSRLVYQGFKGAIVAGFAGDTWELTGDEIKAAIAKIHERRAQDATTS